jgi:hypothetical protein
LVIKTGVVVRERPVSCSIPVICPCHNSSSRTLLDCGSIAVMEFSANTRLKWSWEVRNNVIFNKCPILIIQEMGVINTVWNLAGITKRIRCFCIFNGAATNTVESLRLVDKNC